MKKDFIINHVLLMILQLVISNYFNFTPYAMCTILPLIIFMLPTKFGTKTTLIIAFVSGLAVDYLADGEIGLNALALIPVGYINRFLYRVIFGDEIIERELHATISKYGVGKILFALGVETLVFLSIYILADSGISRPMQFNLVKFVSSFASSMALSVLLFIFLQPKERR